MRSIPLLLVLLVQLSPGLSEARTKKERLRERAAKVVSEVLAEAPVANEVCFSPDSPCEVKLLKFLRSAKTSVEVAIFDLNLESVVRELRNLAERVPVRVVADRRMSKSDHSRIPELKGSKVVVRFGKQRGIMHHKFVVVDGQRLELGSFNFTNGAANKNQENQLYLETPGVVAAYRGRFEKMWSEASY